MSKKWLVLLGLTIGAVLWMRPGAAGALGEATNRLPADSNYIVISDAAAAPGSFRSPISTNYFYVPATSTNASVWISNGSDSSGGDGNFDSIAIYWLDNSGGCNIIGSSTFYPTVNSSKEVNASAYPGAATITVGNTVYRTFCVSVTTRGYSLSNPSRYPEFTYFKLESSTNTYLGVFAGQDTSRGTAFFANTGARWGTTISFAPTCGTSLVGSNRPIALYDLDPGYGSQAFHNVHVELIRRDRATGAFRESVVLNGPVSLPDHGVNGIYKSVYTDSGGNIRRTYHTDGSNSAPWNNNYTWAIYPTNWDEDSRYELRVGIADNSIDGRVGTNNKIRIKLPYDQVNTAITSCPDPNQAPTATFTASCAPGTGVITVSASVTEPEGDYLAVRAEVSGTGDYPSRTEYRTGSGTLELGTFWRPPDGSTYTVSGSTWDSKGASNDITAVTVTCDRPPSVPQCTLSMSPIGTSLPYVQQGGSVQLTITVRNGQTNTSYGASFSSTDWPLTVDPTTIGSAQFTINNYGTLAPGQSYSTTRDYVVNQSSNVYEIVAFLRQSATGNQVQCNGTSVTVASYPYLRTYGGDVIAGSGLGDLPNCQLSTAGINTYVDATASNEILGSGGQMAAFAMGVINGYRTNTQNNNRQPQSKTFANTTTHNMTYGAGLNRLTAFGGNYAGNLCADNWTATTTSTTPISGSVDLAGLGTGVYSAAAGINISGAPIVGRNTIYVNGDVTITNDIRYIGSWPTVDLVPSLVIVANNIYINPNVGSIDGYFIARDTIWTCYDTVNRAAAITVANTAAACNDRRLTVNGALLANKINFWRLGGSIGASAGADSYSTSTMRAAETIRLSPEFLFANQAGRSLNGSDGNMDRTYDAITSLPPTF